MNNFLIGFGIAGVALFVAWLCAKFLEWIDEKFDEIGVFIVIWIILGFCIAISIGGK